MEKYWFVEASPDSEEYYLNMRPDDDADRRWKEAFAASAPSGEMGFDEFNDFYYRLRLDRSNSGKLAIDNRFYDPKS